MLIELVRSNLLKFFKYSVLFLSLSLYVPWLSNIISMISLYSDKSISSFNFIISKIVCGTKKVSSLSGALFSMSKSPDILYSTSSSTIVSIFVLYTRFRKFIVSDINFVYIEGSIFTLSMKIIILSLTDNRLCSKLCAAK